MKIKIISDTTCDLPEQLLKEYQITLLPLHITKGEESLLDGVQITPSDIFSYVDAGGEICTTASINPQEYVDAFAAYRAAYDAVIVITIGSGFSSCYQNACVAARQFEQVYVVDSANLSSGQGLLVLLAAYLAQTQQMEPQQICQKLNEAAQDVDASFILDRLDYMKKGGRCSSVTALGANLLKLKPCIEVKDGKMSVGKKYRGNNGSSSSTQPTACRTIAAQTGLPSWRIPQRRQKRLQQPVGCWSRMAGLSRSLWLVPAAPLPATVVQTPLVSCFLKIHNRRFVIRASGTAENCCAACSYPPK
ncbi:MAG: DegV family protein [Negativibacillus sp.]